MEEVRFGSKQFKPSSSEFDSGVDNLSKPTRFIIWEAYMNSRIFPSYVVSFRTLNSRGKGTKKKKKKIISKEIFIIMEIEHETITVSSLNMYDCYAY